MTLLADLRDLLEQTDADEETTITSFHQIIDAYGYDLVRIALNNFDPHAGPTLPV